MRRPAWPWAVARGGAAAADLLRRVGGSGGGPSLPGRARRRRRHPGAARAEGGPRDRRLPAGTRRRGAAGRPARRHAALPRRRPRRRPRHAARARWWSTSGRRGAGRAATSCRCYQAFTEQYGDRVPVLGVDYQDTQPGAGARRCARGHGRHLPAARRPAAADLHGADDSAARRAAVPRARRRGRARSRYQESVELDSSSRAGRRSSAEHLGVTL